MTSCPTNSTLISEEAILWEPANTKRPCNWNECGPTDQCHSLKLDLSKAFDKVPHERRAIKLRHFSKELRATSYSGSRAPYKTEANRYSLIRTVIHLCPPHVRRPTGKCSMPLAISPIHKWPATDSEFYSKPLFTDDSLMHWLQQKLVDGILPQHDQSDQKMKSRLKHL